MIIQRILAVIMILGSSVLTAWASGDIAFPAILCMLGLLGTWRRFTWDIRPERHFIAPLLLLLLAGLFALHCRYAHVHADQAAAFAWQTIARYFLASMILVLFLRPHRAEDGGSKTGDKNQRADLSSVLGPPSPGLPPSLGLFHLASVMAAGQVLLLDDRYVLFRLSELVSVTLVILYAVAADHRFGSWEVEFPLAAEARRRGSPAAARNSLGRWLLAQVPLGVLLLVAVNLGWVGGSLLYRHVEIVNFLPSWLSRGAAALEGTMAAVSRVGFSNSGKLSMVLSIKEEGDSTPVLSLTGNSNPGYLRAVAFETYHHGAWHDLSYREAITAERNTPFNGFLVGRGSLFRLHEAEASREVIIRHESSVGDTMFTPLGTCAVEAPFSLLMRDDDDIVNSPNVRNRASYRIAYASAKGAGPPSAGSPSGSLSSVAGNPPAGAQWRRMVAVPDQLDPQIRQRATIRIFRGCSTTAEKIDAVIRYFQTDYTYSLGLEIPENQDPVNYFLMKASTGYCEYFASGAAILLRLAGVPTRYVTGFLVTEQGDDARSWVARNADAHAWAEAWDQERGQWTIVEATAQEGLGDMSLADQLTRGAGSGRPFLVQLAESLYEYGLFGVFGQLFESYGPLTGASLSAVFLGAALWLALGSWRRGCSKSEIQNPRWGTLHKMLAKVDRKVRILGYRRHPDETLHAFAARLSGAWRGGSRVLIAGSPLADDGEPPTGNQIADWYLEYAGLRYRKEIDPVRIERLQRLAQELRGG